MDHLPKIEASAFPPLEVPCLCETNDYDRGGFLDFPQRNGWKIDKLRGLVRSDEEHKSPEKITAFVQAWLFFGMLHEVFRISEVEIEFKDFVRDSGNHRIVTTSRLRQYLNNWANRERGQDLTSRREKQAHVAAILIRVDSFLMHFHDSVLPEKWKVTLPMEVLLSILIMAETLKNAAMLIWRFPLRQLLSSPLISVGLFRRQNPLKHYFNRAGWCLNEVAMLEDLVDTTGLYIASLLKRPSLSNEQLHSGCTSQDCNAYQVDYQTYKTKHTRECLDLSSCPFVFVDDQKVSSILENGDKIPVISLTSCNIEDGRLMLEVVESSAYTAFSHVWGHGLGNVKTNSLPRCQIQHLTDLVAKLSQSTGRCAQPMIWIDTLCVPVAKNLKKYRRLAIAKMAETYKKADQVLVLDLELQQALSTASRTELATRILCCSWMRRLWTLQEAVLTDNRPNCEKLYLQFRDGPIAFNSLLRSDILTLSHSEKALGALFSRIPQSENMTTNLGRLTSSLEYRKTSRLMDEPLCLLSILGGNVKRLVDLSSAEQRMQAFYSFLEEIPSEILFHKGRSLEIDGYRWAPISFLSSCKSQTVLRRRHAPPAIHNSQGLHVRFPGFYLSTEKHLADASRGIYFEDPENNRQVQHLWPYLGESDYHTSYATEVAAQAVYKQSQGMEKFANLVFQTDRPAIIINTSDRSEVVLVAVLRETEGTLFCQYLQRGYIRPRPSELLAGKDFIWITAQSIAVNQQWCVR
ncbi:MAG: hypothetical protein Q9187_004523 [Circinaria calcarea]